MARAGMGKGERGGKEGGGWGDGWWWWWWEGRSGEREGGKGRDLGGMGLWGWGLLECVGLDGCARGGVEL